MVSCPLLFPPVNTGTPAAEGGNFPLAVGTASPPPDGGNFPRRGYGVPADGGNFMRNRQCEAAPPAW